MLYQLSYTHILERAVGIEPTWNSLEGCRSTNDPYPHKLTEDFASPFLQGIVGETDERNEQRTA